MTRIGKKLAYLLMIFYCISLQAFNDKTRVAFYYGDNPPVDELHAFNAVVVHPNSHLNPEQYNSASSELYAYVTVGELDKDDPYARKTASSWRVGTNAAWDSRVMDLSNPAWIDFLLNEVVTPLWDAGYHGFFLDTLDSYQLLKLSPEKNKKQLQGIVDLVTKIKTKYPDAKIITNRGFEVLEHIHDKIDAVAAESLFSGWDNAKKTYTIVSSSEREWLLNELNKAHIDYQLPIIVIDYVPANKHQEAVNIAEKITGLGFIPWVADPYLETLGVSTIQIIPRKILLLYTEKPKDQDLSTLAVYSVTAFVLQYMGYIPILQQVDETLPEGSGKDRYAGIIAWFNVPVIKNHVLLEKWLTKQVQAGVPLVFMQNFGIPLTSPFFKLLKMNVGPDTVVKNIALDYKDPSVGFEILPNPSTSSFIPVTSADGHVLLKLKSVSQHEDAIAITSWGGYALEPYHIVSLPNGQSRWVINPFDFFQKALRLAEIPVPDITTASGRRIFISQIDGDAFISRVPWKNDAYAGEVIIDEILEQYKLPIAVSIVQREFELLDAQPEIKERLIKAAQKMFALPWVELATHTYSHPLKWGPLIEGESNSTYLSYPNPSYSFNYKKEIEGSADFINKTLAPPDKKVKIILWSGDANVQEKALWEANQAKLVNLNGMAKILSDSRDSISNLGPYGIYMGKYFHVFSPFSNEFEYTDNWSKPLYAYEKLIHTAELTEKPRRYKPLSIYYHFYSGADQAALRALRRVYDWALKQYIIPMELSVFINEVMSFNQLVLAKFNDGSWLITNNGPLRELRWQENRGKPELASGSNIIGFNKVNDDIYIHLGTANESVLRFTPTAPTRPYLIDANADVSEWTQVNPGLIRFTLQGFLPLEFKLANMSRCQLHQNGQLITATNTDTYSIKGMNHGTFEIQCID